MSDLYTSSSRAKLARADEHLETLNGEIRRWGELDPFRAVRQVDAGGREHLFTLQITRQPDLWRWSVLFGDALHNLRCALDHTIYALAVAQTGKRPPDNDTHLAFPIASDETFFRKASRRIETLDERTRLAVERMQPYNRLKPGRWFQPLWWLAQLNDIDKHRLPHLAPFAAVLKNFAIDARAGTYELLWNTGPVVDGAPLMKITLNEPNPHVQVEFGCVMGVVVDVQGLPGFSIYHVMRHIRREVGVACRYLALFFP